MKIVLHAVLKRFALLVVSGLNDLEVGCYTKLPSVGAIFYEGSFISCSRENRHTASVGLVLNATCSVVVSCQYVIVHSTSSAAGRLCLAEVAVYPATGQCAITFVLVCSNDVVNTALFM